MTVYRAEPAVAVGPSLTWKVLEGEDDPKKTPRLIAYVGDGTMPAERAEHYARSIAAALNERIAAALNERIA